MPKNEDKVLDPRLPPLLEKYNLNLEEFWKVGRPKPDVMERKRELVTELHLQGYTWEELRQITGLFGIARLTNAKGNPKARANRGANLPAQNRARKGEKKPWFSDLLRKNWQEGVYDCHKGPRSKEYCEKIKNSFTPERKEEVRQRMLKQWQQGEYRDRLLSYHRSPEERTKRSKRQAAIMKKSFGFLKYEVFSTKCTNQPSNFKVRSSYEVAAVQLLNEDPNVKSFIYEPEFEIDGRYYIPDFLVKHKKYGKQLIEIKASWVLNLNAYSYNLQKLFAYNRIAIREGLDFEVWTEKDRLKGYINAK